MAGRPDIRSSAGRCGASGCCLSTGAGVVRSLPGRKEEDLPAGEVAGHAVPGERGPRGPGTPARGVDTAGFDGELLNALLNLGPFELQNRRLGPRRAPGAPPPAATSSSIPKTFESKASCYGAATARSTAIGSACAGRAPLERSKPTRNCPASSDRTSDADRGCSERTQSPSRRCAE